MLQDREREIAAAVRELLEAQRVGVLGTYGLGSPYCSLVGFSFEPGLERLYFATTRATGGLRYVSGGGTAGAASRLTMARPGAAF